MRLRSAWLLCTALLTTSCTAAPTWQSIDLGSLRPAGLAVAGDRLLVGGSTSGGPALAVLNTTGTPTALRVAPDGPEAEAAELVQLAVRGDQLQALGTMISGAHSNPRWTVWDSSLSAGTLTSHPQEFFTFGGHDAGPLVGIGWVGDAPVVLGSRTTATGARAALYAESGTTWTEVADRPATLASNPTSQLGFGGQSSAGDQLVIAGDEVQLTQPLRQRPLAWVGRPGGDWTRLELAVPGQDGPGLARAQAVACPAEGTSCWLAGWVHGQLVAWSVTTGTQPSASGPELPAGTTSAAVGSNGSPDPVPQLALWQGRPVLAGNGPDSTLLVRCDSGWRSLPLPDRRDGSTTIRPGQGDSEPSPPITVTGLAGVGARLYVLQGRTLWAIDRSPC
ncbi:hypothetical protein ATK74_2141 [Propionicimonas paludicola]|uniref:Uncharacterized protein n=1 Tax=Propionicimonas paludicola TaxID=185243 RepID=A0A2A9CT76_9ACTN|nr:hypothetical protein [Propionicimonas paludicola]PFG17568.1 hypothetical protein ATK74_2141 [Propionicimonas paludicola]